MSDMGRVNEEQINETVENTFSVLSNSISSWLKNEYPSFQAAVINDFPGAKDDLYNVMLDMLEQSWKELAEQREIQLYAYLDTIDDPYQKKLIKSL